jgi:hypothetical protein
LNLTHQIVHDILTEELGIRQICAKLVPKNLTNKQKESRRNVCLDHLEHIENENFSNVITGDESITMPKPNDKVQSGTRATHRARRKQE